MTRQQSLAQLKGMVRSKLQQTRMGRGSDSPIEAGRQNAQELAIAAERVEQGHYGLCIDCDRPIPLARLRIKPEAVRCTACQERHEHAAPRHRETMAWN